jgi:hypothetical protein
MSEVQHLRIVRREPDQDLIGKLERLLEEAKAGKFVTVAVATQYADGSIGTMYAGGEGRGRNLWTMIGAVSWLSKRLHDAAESL